MVHPIREDQGLEPSLSVASKERMIELEPIDGFYQICTECETKARVVCLTSEDWGCGAYICKQCLIVGLKLLEDVEVL